jgi:hypothetical protein
MLFCKQRFEERKPARTFEGFTGDYENKSPQNTLRVTNISDVIGHS